MGVKRAIILRVRLTFIENALIKSRAKAVGLTKSRFVRQIALGSEIKLKQFTEEEKQLSGYWQGWPIISNRICF